MVAAGPCPRDDRAQRRDGPSGPHQRGPVTAVARGTLIYLEHFDQIRPKPERSEEE